MSEGVRGIPWQIWGRLSVLSWLLLIPAAWGVVFLAWAGLPVLSFGTFGLWLGFAAGSNGVPGAAALLHLRDEGRLLSQAEAAALSALTLSAAAGLLTGFLATCLHMQMGVWIALSGIAFGILYLPLSFGLIFPLAIPLACGFTVWAVVRTYGSISRMGYALLTGVSAIGWLGVALIGPIFGLGG